MTDLEIINEVEKCLSIKIDKLYDYRQYVKSIASDEGLLCLLDGEDQILSFCCQKTKCISDYSFLQKLNNLTTLNLWRQNLTDGAFLKSIKKLVHLDLEYDKQLNLNILKGMTNLLSLNLSNNNLNKIKSLKEFKSLSSLNLSGNNLTDISFLKEMTNLTNLNVRNNNLTNCSPLSELTNLRSLNLANNKISDIFFLKEMNNINSLVLRGNEICDFSVIKYLNNLEILRLDNNPFKYPSRKICEQGISAIRNYLNELDISEGEEYLYETKMVMVGRGSVGKTVLTKKLTIENFKLDAKELSTQGIHLLKNPFIIKVDGLQNADNYRFNIWDFGGQEKYDATHQFFITERSIYLFLTDAREEDNYLDFDYWLNTIKLLGGDSPVLVVITKIDERKKNYPQYQYKERYNIVDFIEVSCVEGYEFTLDALLQKIKEVAKDLPQSRDRLPKIWVTIRRKLEELAVTKEFISYNDYLSICKSYGLDKERADFLGQYLNDLGVIIHHQKDLLLKQLVIINTEWGIDGVYKVLDSQSVIDNNGFFTKDMVEIIWNDEKYKNKQAELLQLMLNYKLCFECKDASGFVAPTLLKYEKPEELIWDDSENIKLVYNYVFMPAGIVTRFIVEAHEYIDDNIFWKYGVKLNYENTNALIEENYIHKNIIVKVQGVYKKNLLAYIRMIFRGIHKSFEKLEFKEMISCICNECKNSNEPTLFEYAELRQYEREGEKFIKCRQKSIKNVEVHKLIDDNFRFDKDSENGYTPLNHQNEIHFHEPVYIHGNFECSVNSNLSPIELQKFSSAIENMPAKILNLFQNEYSKELIEAKTDVQKLTMGNKIKGFMSKYGVTLSEHISAIYLVEFMKNYLNILNSYI